MVANVVFMDSDRPHAAFIVAADGGEAPRRILETELSRTIWAASAIHPEGRVSVIAPGKNIPGGVFFVADRTNSRLSAVDTSAAVPFGLLEPDTLRNLTWNPSGTALIVEAVSDGVPTLWRVPVDPVSLRWRTPERLTTAPASAQAAAVSPDGTRRGLHERAGVDPRLDVPVRGQQRPAHGRRQGTDRSTISRSSFSVSLLTDRLSAMVRVRQGEARSASCTPT